GIRDFHVTGVQTCALPILQALAQLLPATMAATAVLLASGAVMIARWWQAIVYNPGGFRHDFHRLRQGRSAALLVMVIVFIAIMTDRKGVVEGKGADSAGRR